MVKRRARNQIDNLTPNHGKLGMTQFLCMQVACDMPLESSQRGLQLRFRPHFDRRSAQKNYSPTKLRDSQPWRFRDSHLEVPGQKTIRMPLPREGVEYTIWGKVVASPNFGPW